MHFNENFGRAQATTKVRERKDPNCFPKTKTWRLYSKNSTSKNI